VLYRLSYTSSPFCYGYFLEMWVSKLFAQADLQLQCSQISASQVAKIKATNLNNKTHPY
jgi:hypothetical protein